MAPSPVRRTAPKARNTLTTLPQGDESRSPVPSAPVSTTLLERLKALHPQSIDLSLGRIERLSSPWGKVVNVFEP